MTTLGLDIAQTTGWSVLDRGTLVGYGLIQIKLTGDPDLDKTPLKEFKKGLITLLNKYNPNLVVLESIFVGPDPRRSATLNQQRGVAIETIPLDVKLLNGYLSRVRANVLGAGKKHDKKEVFEWAIHKYKLEGFKFTKHNDITDSILLSHWGESLLNNIS